MFDVVRSGSFFMSLDEIEQLQSAIRDIADFPKPGIIFKDITPILGDGKLFRSVIDHLAEEAAKVNPTKVVGIDARGFLFGAAVAYKLGVGCVPVRKKGKLPYKTIGSSYQLEYGDAEVEMHVDAMAAGERAVLVDDLLATGGTSGAAINLVQKVGGISSWAREAAPGCPCALASEVLSKELARILEKQDSLQMSQVFSLSAHHRLPDMLFKDSICGTGKLYTGTGFLDQQ
jgi:adenine phosphoribosyltransferase